MNFLEKILAAILNPSKWQFGSTGTGFDLVPGNLPSKSSSGGSSSVGASSSLDVISSIVGMGYSIYQDQRNWNNMSPADKESIDYQDNVRRQFYEDYESPDKVLAATAKGFQEQGINKMMLAGSSTPSVSASNAPSGGSQASPDVGAVIGSLIGAIQRSQQIDIESSRADAENALKREQAESQRIENKYRDEYLATQIGIMKENIHNVRANTRKLLADSSYAELLAKYAPQLFESDIVQRYAGAYNSVSQGNKAISDIQLNEAEIREIQSKIAVNNKLVEHLNALIMKIEEECILISTQAELDQQMVSESEARIRKYEKQIEEIGTNMGLTKKEIDWYAWNHARENRNKFFGIGWNGYYEAMPWDSPNK